MTLALLKFCAAVEAFSIIAEREWPRERASRMMLLLAITAFVSAITVGVFHVNMSSYDLYRAARLFSVTATATFCAFGLLLYAIQPLNPRAGAVRHAVTLTVLMVAMAAVNWLDLVLPRSMATWQALNHSFFATATLCGMAWVLYGTPRPAASAFR